MDVTAALLDSWERQCRIVEAIALRVDEANRKVKPSEDGWPLDVQLAHVHQVRKYWLAQLDAERAKALPQTLAGDWETAIDDLQAIKAALQESGKAVGEVVAARIADGQPTGGYENPVLFLQHMIWHEGWHVGLIMLAFRLAGQEAPDEWEEANLWGQWRTETWPG